MSHIRDDRRQVFGTRGARLRLRPVSACGALFLGLWFAATPVSAAGGAERCQRAIERTGSRYAARLLRSIERCARHGAEASLAQCLASEHTRMPLDRLRLRWTKRAVQACANVDVGSELGYFDTCAPEPSGCGFASGAVAAPGDRNDLIDCLACRTDEQLGDAGSRLFAGRPVENSCQRAIGDAGLGLLRSVLSGIEDCLRGGGSTSIAGCLSETAQAASRRDAVNAWRAAATHACAGTDPFTQLGYPQLCGGVNPVESYSCPLTENACAFRRANRLSLPQADDDLIDCLECLVSEAALGSARVLYGAELCCTGDGCSTVMTRMACHHAGGRPAYYRLDPVDFGDVFYPYAVAAAADDTIYVAELYGQRVLARDPDGTVRTVGFIPGLAYGIDVDAAGNVYIGLPGDNRVVRMAPDGSVSEFAGTGEAAHSGDGGLAVEAGIYAPNDVSVDDQGNVYVAESGVSAIYYGNGSLFAEHVRRVDPSGIIETVAGAGQYGFNGMGGPALDAQLGYPYRLSANADGSLLIGEVGLHRVLRLEANGLLKHIAGRPTFTLSGVGAFSGDGGSATSARLYGATGVGTDNEGKIFIADRTNGRIRMVDSLGSIITVAGNGEEEYYEDDSGDGVAGPYATAGCPIALAIDTQDRVYFADSSNGRIRVLTSVPF